MRELFRVAEEHAPSIVFIDEIDAVGTKRYDSNSGGEREIQRTMLELLNQLDGFDSRGDVKVHAVLHYSFVPYFRVIIGEHWRRALIHRMPLFCFYINFA